MNAKKNRQSSCESCINYEYDELYGCYYCAQELDEDEMYSFLTDTFGSCPYYRAGDEYTIVRKQN